MLSVRHVDVSLSCNKQSLSDFLPASVNIISVSTQYKLALSFAVNAVIMPPSLTAQVQVVIA
jgi:hypothetical protein